MNAPSTWQLVLYGRTRRADRWWRVRPREVDIEWLNKLVITTTGGGEELDRGPRFVAARRGDMALVGGASRASLLNDTMNSDGSRPLYTFVGWLSRDPNAAFPLLEECEARWPDWARAEYSAWMRLDWDRHQSDLADAHESPYRPAYWSSSTAGPDPQLVAQGIQRPHDRNAGPAVVSCETRHEVWRNLTASHHDFAFVACVARPPFDVPAVLTHLAVLDLTTAPSAPARQEADPEEQPHDLPPETRPSSPTPPARHPVAQSPTEGKGGLARVVGRLRKVVQAASDPTTGQDPEPPPTPPATGPAKDLSYWRETDGAAPDHPPGKGPRPNHP